MKKTLIALAAVAAATGAMAQATISGTINVGVMNTGQVGASTAVQSLGGGANAINLTTTEDLGGGLKSGFTGQIRFNAATGDRNSAGTGNALFHAANAYVSGGFGTVRVGKIAEASNCAFDPWACTGGAALSAGSAGVSALIGAQTLASSLSYESPNFSGFTIGLQTTLSTRSNERRVINLGYAAGPLAVQILRTDGNQNTVADNGATAVVIPADADTSGQSLGVSYDFGMAKVSFVNAVSKSAAGVSEHKINSLGLTVPMGAYTILAGYNKNSGTAVTSANDTKLSVGVNYALSKRTTMGADLFRAEQTGGTTGYVVRLRHTF